jgi:hypothetical protein
VRLESRSDRKGEIPGDFAWLADRKADDDVLDHGLAPLQISVAVSSREKPHRALTYLK